MEKGFKDKWTGQLKKGLLLFLVIHVIKKKNSYGHGIIKEIHEHTGIRMADGTLYPILKKLKQEQLVLTRWDVSDDKPPRKLYYLTGKGSSLYKEMKEYWGALSGSIETFIE